MVKSALSSSNKKSRKARARKKDTRIDREKDAKRKKGPKKGPVREWVDALLFALIIMLIVMDVNGPFERGLVFATHAQYRELLPDLKQFFSRRVTAIERRRHFADYYYNEADGRWYVTGYNGSRFVLRRISRPNLDLGRPSPEMLR